MRLFNIPYVLLFLVLLVWISLVPRSLWLDETIMYWSIQDGFAETLHRVVHYQNQSGLYNLALWAGKHVFGESEIALRLLSFAAMLATGGVVFVLARRFFSRETALLAVFFFATLEEVVAAATNARPYSFAIFFATLATLMLLRWMDELRAKYLAGYALSIVAMIYTHFTFAAVVALHCAYLHVAAARRPALRAKSLRLYLALTCAALALIPALPQLRLLRERSAVLSFAPMPGIADLAAAWLPANVALAILAGILAARISSPFACRTDIERRRTGIGFVACWWITPALLCFILSRWSGGSIFVPRYYSWATPAAALMIAWIVDMFSTERARLFFAGAFALVFFAGETVRYRGTEDWRGAIEYARSVADARSAPVLGWTGAIELQDPSWWSEPKKREYILAPFSYYRLSHPPLALPRDCESAPAREFLRNDLLPRVSSARTVLAVVRLAYIEQNKLSNRHFTECFASFGYALESERTFDHVSVLTLTNTPSATTDSPRRDTPL